MQVSRRRRVLLRSAVTGGALTAIGAAWFAVLNVPPTAPLPSSPLLPRPNAYDFYVRAGGQEIGGDEKTRATTSPSRDQPLAPLPARVALLEANAPALRTLREGFAYDYRKPEGEWRGAAKMRELARCLRFAGDTEAERGRLAEAAGYYGDALHFGADIGNGNLVDRLTGMACESIGRKPLWKIIDRLDAATARREARRLEQAIARRGPFADIVAEDARQSRAYLRDLFRRRTTFQALDHQTATIDGTMTRVSTLLGVDISEDAAARKRALWRNRFALLTRSKRHIDSDLARYAATTAAWARRPYDGSPAPAPPDDPILRYLYVRPDAARLADADAHAQDALLMAALALRAYRLERGRYPASLDELVQAGYLARVPADPLAADAPVRYRRESAGNYRLYSVGPNREDDNGRPIEAHYPDGERRKTLDATDIGDFVVGANTP